MGYMGDSMDTTIKVIKNEQDHARAIERLLNLMAAGEEHIETIELLSLLIQDYERKVSPTPDIDPIDAIRFRMEQMGLVAKDLIPYMGSQSKVSEVLNRKRPLTLPMIRSLHKSLGIPADVLLSEEHGQIDLSTDPEFDPTKYPLLEMAKRGYFGDQYKATPIQQLKDQAEILMRKFMSAVGASNHQELALLRAPQSQNGNRSMNDCALTAWMARVRQKAKLEEIETPYKCGLITEGWAHELVKLSRFKEGPRLAKEHLAHHGIVLVIEPHFKKTYLDGAAMLVDDRAVVGMTLRHDRLDNFWFVLLHEIGHIALHLNAELPYIADDLEDKVKQATKIEKEADEFAQKALIPPSYWNDSAVSRSFSPGDAQQLARDIDVSVAIVAGRVRHTTGNWRLLQNLLGKGEVKEMFGINANN